MILTRSDMRIVEVVVGFVCNKCGMVYTTGEDKNAEEGLIGCEIAAGYGACHLTDGIKYTFSICEKCLSELFDTFAVPVRQLDCNEFHATPEEEAAMATAAENLKAVFGDLDEALATATVLNEKVSFSLEEITNIRRELNIPDESGEPEEPLPGLAILPEPEKA